MRFCQMLQAAVAFAAVMFPFSLTAQFQQPTPEELSMKEEPKAPGSAAIYLYREETVDDNLHYHSFYARIKVLTEKGKELATVSVPYGKRTYQVTDVKARTIHADGTVIPLDVKPADLVEHKVGDFQLNKMVFTLPSVEVGSILEYRWQLRYDDSTLSSPEWEVQQPYFVRKAHYDFLPFKHMDEVTTSRGDIAGRLLYSAMLPKDTKVDYVQTTGRYKLDAIDVAALPEEDFMPPLATLKAQVDFYYTPYDTQDEFWKKEGEHWSKERNHFADESKGLKEAVGQIIAAGDTEEQKANKIYDAVMALDNTDYTRKKSAAEMKQEGIKKVKQAEDVWKQKSGSRDEIALLYLAMVRIAGLKAYALTVCNRDLEIFNPYFLSLGQLDDDLVLVTIGGKETIVDPGRKFASFGELDWRHTLAGGIRQSDKGVLFAQTHGNNYKEATTLRVADVTIERDGSVSGTVRVSMNGPQALYWRQLAVENDEDEVKKQFNESMKELVPDGVSAEFDHFLGLKDYKSVLMGIVKISGNMGTATGKRVFLPGVFFESHVKHPFVAQDKRLTSVDMHFADSVHDEVTYHVPESLVVESTPTDANIPWTGHAVFTLKSAVDKKAITVNRTLVKGFTLLEPKYYSELHDFYQKIAAADQQQLVLTAAPAASNGN